MRKYLLLILFIVLSILSSYSQGITWVGTTSTSWSTSSNWSTNTIPTSSNNITIPSSAPNMPTLSGVGNVNKITINSGATLTLGAGATLNVSGNFANNGTFTDNGGTTNFNGSSAQSYTGITMFNNVTVSSTGGLTLASNLAANGTLSISSGATLSAGTSTVTISGSFTNNGTFNAGTSVVVFSGASTQTIPAATYYWLTVANNCNLGGDITVTKILKFKVTGITITTGANTINMAAGSTITGSGSTAYVNGNLEMNFSGSVLTQTYPIGTSTTYAPVSIIYSSVTSPGGVTVSSTDGDEPNIATSPIDATANVKRYWTITKNSGTFGTYSTTFNFVAGDLGTGASTSTFKVAAYSSGAWTGAFTAGTLTSTSTQATGISTYGDFQVGNTTSSPTWLGTTSTDWATSSNWNTNTVPTSSNNVTIPSSASNMPMLSGVGTVNNITINSGATLTLGAGSTLNVSGNYTNNGTVSAQGGTTVFNSSSAQTLTGTGTTTFSNLTVSGTGGLTLSSSVTANGTLTISSGSSLSAGSNTITIGGNFTNNGTFTAGTSTVVFNGSSAQSYTGITTFNNVTVSSTGGLTLASNLTANGTLSISSGATLSAGSSTVTISGSFTNSGTFTAGTSVVVFSGASTQTIPAATYYWLTVANNCNLGGDITITNTLKFKVTGITITTGANTINMAAGSTITGSGSTAYVNGNLEMNFSGSVLTQTYPIGTSTTYAPVSIIYSSVTSPGGVTVSSTDGDEPNIATSPIDATANVKRYWTITKNSGTFGTYSATFNFVAGDLGTGASTSTFKVAAYSSGAWTGAFTTGTLTSTSTQATGISTYGDFQVGNTTNSPTWLGTTSTDWATSSNWNTNTVPTNSNNVIIPSSASNMPMLSGVGTVNNITINSGATLTLGAGSTLNVSGNYTNNGTFTDNGGTTNFNGSSAQTLAGTTTFTNFKVSGTGGLTLSSSVTANGTLTISSGSSLSAGSNTITIGGNFTNNGTFTAGTSTVVFNGSSAQSYTGITTFNNVTVSSTGGLTLASNLTANGTLSISSGATLLAGSSTVTISGSFTNSGTFTAGTSVVVFSGASTQTIPAATYYGLTVANNCTLGGNITVTNTLKFKVTGITITTGANTINMAVGSTITGSGSTAYVNGNLEMNFSGSVLTQTYPIGTSTTYAPVSIIYSSVTSPGGVTVSSTDGDEPNIATSAIDATANVKRYWTITKNSGTFGTYSATFNFVAGDLGTGASTSTFVVAAYSSGAWTEPFTAGTVTSTSTQATGISTYGDFQVGNITSSPTWVGTTSTNWFTSSNWNTNSVPISSSSITIPSSAPNMPTLSGIGNVNNITINSGATLTLASGATLKISGNYTNNGTFTDNGGTTNFNGSSAQTLTGATTFSNLTTSGTGGLTLSSSVTANGTLTISSGSSLSAGPNTITIGGNFTNSGTFTAGTSTVTFNGSSVQALTGTATFNNLTVSSTSGLILASGSNPTIDGTLNISAGATLSAGSNTITITGSFTNSGTFTPATSTVVFNGTSAQTIPALTFNNLMVSNSSSLGGNVIVNNTLTLSNAIITTGSNTLNIGGSISGAGSSAYINGNLEMNFSSGLPTQTFPIGTSTTYAPVSLTFTSVGSPGGVTVSTTDGDEPNIATSPVDVTANVNRYWTIANTGSITFSTYSATFNFVAGDLGSGANPNSFIVAEYTGGSWTALTTGTLTSTSSQATGITQFGDFQVGNEGGTMTWTGTTSTDWFTSSNWNFKIVPSSAASVVIPSAVSNMPAINGSATINSITINSGATLTLNSGSTLTVSGDFTNNGTFTDQGGTTIFNGSSAQTLTGATTFNSLTLNGAGGLTLSNATTVSGVSGVGVLTLTNGTLTSNGNLTVDLDNAEIAYNSGDAGAISGNITVAKTVSSIGNHYLGCPLGSVTASQLNSATEVINPSTQQTRLFSYTPGDANYTPITDTTNTILAPSTGYSFYIASSPATLTFAGSYTHGANYSSSISCSNSASNSILFGNPYPSTLDWNSSAWNKTNVANTIYYFDSQNSRYATYNGSTGTNGGTQYVPPLQGFFVNTTGTGGTATMGVSSDARVTSTDPAFWRKAALTNTLSITAANDSVSDETIISLSPYATLDFDHQCDANKFFNPSPVPSLYTVLDGINYAMNYLPDTLQNCTIPLNFMPGSSGKYSFTAKQVGEFDPSYAIILTDSLMKTTQDLTASPNYSFAINQGDPQGRFSVSFRKANSSVITDNTPKVAIYSYGKKINVLFKNIPSDSKAELTVIDLLGRSVLDINNIDVESGTYSYTSALTQGIYIAMVNVDGKTYTVKIYIE